MAARPWTVLPHAPLEKHEDNFWSVEGELPPGMPLKRRMSIARLGDGRLVFANAVPLDEPSMAELERWGTPAFLLVPNGYHRLDLAAWKLRYPALQILAAAPSARRVSQIVAVDGGFDRLPADANVEHLPLATKTGEGVLRVRSPRDGATRTSLSFYGDVIMNNPDVPGVKGFVYGKLLGSTGGPRITRIARWFVVADANQLAAELRALADDAAVVRLVPCHGGIMSDNPQAVLRTLADAR